MSVLFYEVGIILSASAMNDSTKKSTTRLPFRIGADSAYNEETYDRLPIAEHWASRHEEGQLAVDVLEIGNDIVVLAALAGTKPEDISLHLQDDLLTIRGSRIFPIHESHTAFHRECHWGLFSRTIVLPVDVRQESARAEYRNGVLIIRLEKSRNEAKIPLIVVEE